MASGGPALSPSPAPSRGSSGTSGSSESNGDHPLCAPEGAIRYHAFLEYGACCDVVTPRGTWVGRSAFPSAPKDVSEQSCTYWWSPAQPKNTPELEALRALYPSHLALDTQGSSSCELTTPRGTATFAPPGVSVGTPTGVTGCDVCGRLGVGTEVFVILPDVSQKAWTLVAGTSDGRRVAFDVTPPTDSKQVFSVELPRDPSGATYSRSELSVFAAQ